MWWYRGSGVVEKNRLAVETKGVVVRGATKSLAEVGLGLPEVGQFGGGGVLWDAPGAALQ